MRRMEIEKSSRTNPQMKIGKGSIIVAESGGTDSHILSISVLMFTGKILVYIRGQVKGCKH